MYLALVNLLAATLCAVDKQHARSRMTRVSEKTLFIVAAIGGSPTMYVSMRMLHHKTRKKRFMVGLPIMMVVQVGLIALFWYIPRFF